MTGIVKFWNPSGWGIITPHGVKLGDREREVFVHHDKLAAGLSKLIEGQEVEFSLNPLFTQRPRALDVKLLVKTSYVPISQGRKAAYGAD
jgi:cold shock CspA family protein